MKMNIKGLVFVGFAAAVFASAANAAGDKIVTSKTYVDGKVVDTLTGNETDKAPSVHAVKDLVGAEYTGQDGIDVDENSHVITNAGVREVASGTTNGTVSVNTNGTSTDVAVTGLKDAAYLGKDESIDSSSTHSDAATAKAVYDYVGTLDTDAYTGDGLIDVTDHVITTTAEVNVLEGITVGGTAVTLSNKVAPLGAAAGKAVDTTITSTAADTAVPTSKAVYDFLNNGASTANCSDTNPCAFVLGSNGTPEWKPIAQ